MLVPALLCLPLQAKYPGIACYSCHTRLYRRMSSNRCVRVSDHPDDISSMLQTQRGRITTLPLSHVNLKPDLPEEAAAMQIREALTYFQAQAEAGAPKVQALYDALAGSGGAVAGGGGGGALGQAQRAVTDARLPDVRAAYLAARPEYEQIEVLAPGFDDVDCWIDCRACAPPAPDLSTCRCH